MNVISLKEMKHEKTKAVSYLRSDLVSVVREWRKERKRKGEGKKKKRKRKQ